MLQRQDITPEGLYSIGDVSLLLKSPVSYIRRMIAGGHLTAFRVCGNGSFRVTGHSLLALLEGDLRIPGELTPPEPVGAAVQE